jgi:alpha-tubulin suppressor-like RCC1 family protein
MNTQRSFSSLASFYIFQTEEGELLGWGRTYLGLPLDPSLPKYDYSHYLPSTFSLPPTPLSSSPEIVDFASGGLHTLALTKDGFLFIWGSKEATGHQQLDIRVLPQIIETPSEIKIKRVFAGRFHSAFLTTDGRLFTWGRNYDGQLGLGLDSKLTQVDPALVPLPSPVLDVTCGATHMMVVCKGEDGIYVWGCGNEGVLGFGDYQKSFLPKKLKISGTFPVCRVFAGASRSMALTTNGDLYAWGSNYKGVTGVGDTDGNSKTPRLILSRETFGEISEIAVGMAHNIALLKDNSLIGWGEGTEGQLGSSAGFSVHPSPKKISENFFPDPEEKIKVIGTAGDISWAITENGNLYMWGSMTLIKCMNAVISSTMLGPVLFPGRKFKIPGNEWETVFQWIFLGRIEKGSTFAGMPSEIVYHFVTLLNIFK